MREMETSLQQFGEFLLGAQMVKEKAAPHCVRWVHRFLTRPASTEPLADQARQFCEELERGGGYQDWQVTHLAVRQKVAASTQNHGLLRDSLPLPRGARHRCGGALECGESQARQPPAGRAHRAGDALLGAMRGTNWLMAALIYGGGLRVSECCELRVKDLDFDQGLILVRGGKGGKDRSTLLAKACQDEVRAQLRKSEAVHRTDRVARRRRDL